MTVKVFEDMVAGQVGDSQGSGTSATRIFIVQGVEGNRHQIIFNSLNTGKVPKVGDPHPGIPNIFVESRNATPKDSDIVEVQINYKPRSISNSSPDEEAQTQISISGTVQTVKTNKHIKLQGNKEVEELMILKYKYPTGKAPDGVDNTKEAVHTAEKQEANIVVKMSKQESFDPINLANKYVSKLNSKTFLGTKPFTWMCTNISGQSNDSGETYQNTYEFQFAPDGWEIDAAFADEQSGKIPVDIESQALALQNFRLQRSLNFKLLKLEGFS